MKIKSHVTACGYKTQIVKLRTMTDKMFVEDS